LLGLIEVLSQSCAASGGAVETMIRFDDHRLPKNEMDRNGAVSSVSGNKIKGKGNLGG
jgi:hypothetical protein